MVSGPIRVNFLLLSLRFSPFPSLGLIRVSTRPSPSFGWGWAYGGVYSPIVAYSYHLQAHYTKGTAFLCLLRYTWFSVLFHSSFAILFNFPSRYSFLYRCMFVFSLRCIVHLSSSFVLILYSFLLISPPIRDFSTLFGFCLEPFLGSLSLRFLAFLRFDSQFS